MTTGLETRPTLTDDAFLGGAVHILQPAKGYRAGLDAVLLAAAAPISGEDTVDVLDAGSGVGTVGLCVASRCPGARVTLVEREPILADLARENAVRNQLDGRTTVVVADLALGGSMIQGGSAPPGLRPAAFDHLLANPPYRISGTGTAALGLKRTAHEHGRGDLQRWLAALVTLARADATLTMIHEAAALPEILAACDGRFGGLLVLPVSPRVGEPANRVIIQGRKASRAPLQLRAPFVVHGEAQTFTPLAEAVLRHGAPLLVGGQRSG
jgi:tRNA1(Val) A37 N6-methylase TrmN6